MASEFDKDLEGCVEGETITESASGTFGESETYFIVRVSSDGRKYLEETGHSGNLVDNR
ncbi:MAG: hypothetical protein WC796_05790 [Candidatus Pacearchaeota archaeon]|jgi:hypothetical protein